MPISDEEMKNQEEMIRQRTIVVVEWLMKHPGRWFSETELMEQFPTWDCCMGTILVKIKYLRDGDDEVVEHTTRRVKKVVKSEYSDMTYETCESLDYFKISAEYMARRKKYEKSGRITRMFMGSVYPYGDGD